MKNSLALIVLIDGLYHTFASFRTIKRTAPDWSLLKAFFNMKGLSLQTHRIIGVTLIITSLIYLTKIYNITTFYENIIMWPTIIILAIAGIKKLTEIKW